jgi:molecular chaperone GrpE
MADAHKSGARGRKAPAPPGEDGGSTSPQTPAPPRHTSGQGSTDSASKSRNASVDPELVEDLGLEFELRGDVLEDELEAARAEAAECRDRALRTQAEFENFRKRITREREEERRRAGERLVGELLPVIDSLERAVDHTTVGGELEQLRKGVAAVHTQLVGVLEKEGVEVIDPFGQHFDPTAQQAVSQQEDTEVAEGTVVDVFQKGYALGGRIIRPAMVVVSSGGPPHKE